MAGAAIQLAMLARKLESHLTMIKFVPIRIDTIVASQTITPKCLQVNGHKFSIDLFMTADADGLIKARKVLCMAGVTRKRRPICLSLVGSECIAEDIMGNVHLGQIDQ